MRVQHPGRDGAGGNGVVGPRPSCFRNGDRSICSDLKVRVDSKGGNQRGEEQWEPDYGELRKLVKGFDFDPVGKGDSLEGSPPPAPPRKGRREGRGVLGRAVSSPMRREQALETMGSGGRPQCCPW